MTVKDKSLNAPKSLLQRRAASCGIAAQPGSDLHVENIPRVPKIIHTRKRILINKHNNPRAVNGVETASGSQFTGKFRKPKFFEEVPDAPRQSRNASHIQHQFSVADGFAGDVWMTSTQAAYGFTPEEYPAGFMSNQGIAAMYSSYAHTGKFSRASIYRRPVGLD